MHIDWTITGVIIAGLTLIITYFQLRRTPSKLAPPSSSPIKNKNILLDQIIAKKSINVGYFPYLPFVSVSSGSTEPTGYFPSLIKSLADENNLEIKWIQTTISDSVDYILTKKVDIIISIFQTVGRVKFVDFCCLSHSVKIGGVAKESLVGVNSLSDLASSNLKIVVGKNEIGQELVEVLDLPVNRLSVIQTEDVAGIVAYVEIGQADVAILDSVSIKNFFDTIYTKKVLLKPIFQANPLLMCLSGIMLPKNEHKLSHWLETGTKKYRRDEKLKEMENHFLAQYDGIINRL